MIAPGLRRGDKTTNHQTRFLRHMKTQSLVRILAHIGAASLTVAASAQGTYLSAPDGDPGQALIVDDFGRLGIGTPSPLRPIHVETGEIHSGGPSGGFSFSDRWNPGFVHFPDNGARWVWYAYDATARLWSNGDRIAISGYTGNVGIGAEKPETKLDVRGTIRGFALEVVRGADLAEAFDSTETLEPGTVVSVDTENPGKVRKSVSAYDPCILGVVSGAGGIAPGLVLRQQGTLADGRYPVAAAGRVYCLCDASAGPIQPGSILTSSPVAGHAMKATDASKMTGTLLGKALTRLEKGRGLVLVMLSGR